MATLVTAPTASTATPRVRSNRAVIGATSTYIYRTSGGAIATATANVVMMLEHAIYSVISPEGAASILWRDAARAKDAAAALKITAQDLKKLGIIDEIVPEPLGGAHRQPDVAIAADSDAIARALQSLEGVSADVLRTQRREKFLGIGRGL